MKRWTVVALAVITLFAGGWTALARLPLDLPAPVAAVVHLPERLLTRWIPPRGGRLEGLAPEEQEAAWALARRLDARIVWSSNRDGNHELYLVDLRAQTARRLTNHPNVDFFSRFSPDGTQIVFLRSQRPWVSFREETAWGVYLLDLKTDQERLLARQGYHPTWTADGRGVIFVRGNQVLRVDLKTGREELFFDAPRELPGVDIGDVELSADGTRLATVTRGRLDGAGVWDLTRRTLIPLTKAQACQLTWAPDSAVLWVAAEGRGGTRIMRAAGPGAPAEVLIDLPGRYSHEYFPKLSNDGRWLIWGAAAEGHEHDRADYEIFLWEVGTPWEQAIRLTYYTGNDQWPDIYIPVSSTARPAAGDNKGTFR